MDIEVQTSLDVAQPGGQELYQGSHHENSEQTKKKLQTEQYDDSIRRWIRG